MSKAVALTALLVACWLFVFAVTANAMEQPTVVELDDETFFDRLDDGNTWLVLFYAPWCGHCKAATREMNAALETLHRQYQTLAAEDADSPGSGDDFDLHAEVARSVRFGRIDATKYNVLEEVYPRQSGYPYFFFSLGDKTDVSSGKAVSKVLSRAVNRHRKRKPPLSKLKDYIRPDKNGEDAATVSGGTTTSDNMMPTGDGVYNHTVVPLLYGYDAGRQAADFVFFSYYMTMFRHSRGVDFLTVGKSPVEFPRASAELLSWLGREYSAAERRFKKIDYAASSGAGEGARAGELAVTSDYVGNVFVVKDKAMFEGTWLPSMHAADRSKSRKKSRGAGNPGRSAAIRQLDGPLPYLPHIVASAATWRIKFGVVVDATLYSALQAKIKRSGFPHVDDGAPLMATINDVSYSLAERELSNMPKEKAVDAKTALAALLEPYPGTAADAGTLVDFVADRRLNRVPDITQAIFTDLMWRKRVPVVCLITPPAPDPPGARHPSANAITARHAVAALRRMVGSATWKEEQELALLRVAAGSKDLSREAALRHSRQSPDHLFGADVGDGTDGANGGSSTLLADYYSYAHVPMQQWEEWVKQFGITDSSIGSLPCLVAYSPRNRFAYNISSGCFPELRAKGEKALPAVARRMEAFIRQVSKGDVPYKPLTGAGEVMDVLESAIPGLAIVKDITELDDFSFLVVSGGFGVLALFIIVFLCCGTDSRGQSIEDQELERRLQAKRALKEKAMQLRTDVKIQKLEKKLNDELARELGLTDDWKEKTE